MKPPGPFAHAIDALNAEGVFSPNAITAKRLVKLPDGSKIISTFKPYWVELRDGFLMFKQTVLLDAVDPAERFKPDTFSRLSKALTKLVPADDAYRKAQAVFVRTLRDLVEKWRESDCNLAACFAKYPDVRRRIEGLLRRQPLILLPASSGPSLLINPLAPGAAFGLERYPRGKDKPVMRARQGAITVFIRLVQHPEHTRMGKCVRCGRYFFGRPGQKCCPRPRRCGSHLAAIEATKRKWKQERQDKLLRAQAELAKWQRRKPSVPWKPWIAQRINVTAKWLTRAVNAGELEPPRTKKERRNAD